MATKKVDAIYMVRVKLPLGVSEQRMRSFIKEAVESWSGQLAPDDPLFGFNKCTVKFIISER